jgi:hypothetical protein
VLEDIDFKLWYTGITTTKNGIGIMLDKSLKDGVVDIKRQGDMIILVKFFVRDLVFNVIRLTSTSEGKSKFSSSRSLCMRETASNRRGKRARHFAFDERGELKIHTLSHRRQQSHRLHLLRR